MRLHRLEGRSGKGYTTWGCIWPKATVTEETEFSVVGKAKGIPVQSRVTAYYPDGSVKWTAHTADSSKLGTSFSLETSDDSSSHFNGIGIATESDSATPRILTNGTMTIAFGSKNIFSSVSIDGVTRLKQPSLRLIIHSPVEDGWKEKFYDGVIDQATVESFGPLEAVIRYQGSHHAPTGETLFPFLVRMFVGFESHVIRFQHTFVYDGDENHDYLKGIGISFGVPSAGPVYNRHVKFELDHGCFHESSALLLSWKPKVPLSIYQDEIAGKLLHLEGDDKTLVDTVLKDMPFWDHYALVQDSVSHFSIRKWTGQPDCRYINCFDGQKTRGGCALGSELGNISFAFRDFWQKYPSGCEFDHLTQDEATATVWLYPPSTEPYDFRHYANRGYNQVYYEGYDYKGADPYGIASTSEFALSIGSELIPDDFALHAFSRSIQNPPLFVCEPEYYHANRAFGYWSLPQRDRESMRFLEEQLDRSIEFYAKEVKQRNWYGLFDYGDVRHTYDPTRHMWRYDMGGYAWDNTELVPTLWLWYAFLRSGNAYVFDLAERLSRHASEVDVYHIGKFKGMGSRHNVSHWGCPCKEARIAMAGHHRFLYYLTGDRRLGDIFDELKDNELTFLEHDPLADFYAKEDMVYPSHARSGPDWSSLCSNWMTAWERGNDERYHQKILIGLEDIKQAPLQLISGPDFEFDPESCHLRYIGECAAGGTHLQICMGAPQIWMELSLLSDDGWPKLLADYGRFYFLPRSVQLEESQGIIGEREFSLPFMATAMGAYAAAYWNDDALAMKVWQILLHALISENDASGFSITRIRNSGGKAVLKEIPWISTNFAAQWGLNVIMVLEFIRDRLPETMVQVMEMLKQLPDKGFRQA